ncbi:MAG: hydroxyacylglutathione hydrolase [Myxococcota bacterium]
MQHVVTEPTRPFSTRSGQLDIHQVPSWQDNLIWLVVHPASGEAAAVDGPEAGTVLDYCESLGVKLAVVVNTHTHPDHIGINRDLQKRGLLSGMRVFGPKKVADKIPGLTHPLSEGDEITLGDVTGRVMLTEGHLDGHLSYVLDDILFCGDTLFAGGCGYLFDGPPAKMHDSLSRLAALPDATKVCCAHEYTEDNLRFAWSVEPDNAALAQRIRSVWAIRAKGGSTVPSTIAAERATNPFLRWHSAGLVERVRAALPNASLDTPAEVFAATRHLKDLGHHKTLSDEQLPLYSGYQS